MELQALLASNILPSDIVCQEIYKHLWRNRNLLNEAQTEAIVEDHFHLKKIIRAYFICDQYSHIEYDEDDEDDDYDYDAEEHYLSALVSEMLCFLKYENYSWDDSMKTIYFLWKKMTVSMKSELYQSTREYYMSHIPEHNKQRELEKKLIKIDAIKRILRKEFRYISHSTDIDGLLIDIETIKRSL
jgi:hypothetical protein